MDDKGKENNTLILRLHFNRFNGAIFLKFVLLSFPISAQRQTISFRHCLPKTHKGFWVIHLSKAQSDAHLWQQLIRRVLMITSGEDLRVMRAKVHIEAEG